MRIYRPQAFHCRQRHKSAGFGAQTHSSYPCHCDVAARKARIMKVLVLGGSGFLGTNLAFSLFRSGHTSGSFSRTGSPYFHHSYRTEDYFGIDQVLSDKDWDLVINTVAISSHEACRQNPLLARRVNADLAVHFAEACHRNKIPFVQISTDAVFSGNQARPYGESDPADGTSVYGRTKRKAEEQLLRKYPESLIVRTNFFGWSASGQKGILDFFYQSMLRHRQVSGFTDYITSSVYSDDLLEPMSRLVALGRGGIFHVASSSAISKYEFGLAIAEAAGLERDLVQPGQKSEHFRVSRGDNLSLDVSLVEGEIGNPLPSTRQGLERAITDREAALEFFARGVGGGEIV